MREVRAGRADTGSAREMFSPLPFKSSHLRHLHFHFSKSWNPKETPTPHRGCTSPYHPTPPGLFVSAPARRNVAPNRRLLAFSLEMSKKLSPEALLREGLSLERSICAVLRNAESPHDVALQEAVGALARWFNDADRSMTGTPRYRLDFLD